MPLGNHPYTTYMEEQPESLKDPSGRLTINSGDSEPNGVLFRRLLFAAIGLMSCFAAWALSSPLGSSPDENFHVGSIWCADGWSNDYCKVSGYDSRTNAAGDAEVPHVMDVCFIFYTEQSGDCSWDPRSIQPALPFNQGGQYPNLFYATMNLLVTDQSQVSGLAMRAANSLLATVLLISAVLLSPRRSSNSVVIGFTATLVPLAMFLIPSLNPSSWAFLGLAFGWAFQINAITINYKNYKWLSISNWVLFFVATAIAMGSRWDAMLMSSMSIVLVLLLCKFSKVKISKASMIFSLGSFAVGISTLINHYKPAGISSGGVFGNSYGGSATQWDDNYRFFHNLVHVIELPAGTLGLTWGIGWLDTPIPTIVALITMGIFSYFFMQSIPFLSYKFLLVNVSIWIFGILLLMYYLTGSSVIVGEVVQPRYILPLIPFLLSIAVWSGNGWNISGRDNRVRLLVFAGLLTVANSIALWTNIKRYTIGLEANTGVSLSTNIEWWWDWAPSPNLVLVVGTFGFAIYLVSIFMVINSSEGLTRKAAT